MLCRRHHFVVLLRHHSKLKLFIEKSNKYTLESIYEGHEQFCPNIGYLVQNSTLSVSQTMRKGRTLYLSSVRFSP